MWKTIKEADFETTSQLVTQEFVDEVFDKKSRAWGWVGFVAIIFYIFNFMGQWSSNSSFFKPIIVISSSLFGLILIFKLLLKKNKTIRLIDYFLPTYLLITVLSLEVILQYMFFSDNYGKNMIIPFIIELIFLVYLNYIFLKKGLNNSGIPIKLSSLQIKLETASWLFLGALLLFAGSFRVLKLSPQLADQASKYLSSNSFSLMILIAIIGLVPAQFIQFTVGKIVKNYWLVKYSEEFKNQYNISDEVWKNVR
jgi:hypothetical protein